MFEPLHIPDTQQYRFWFYTGNKTGSTFQTWTKPAGINFIQIIAVGGGGGGFAPLAYNGSTRAGGGGGGAGAISSLFVPAYLVPDQLYICTGLGGAGGIGVGAAGSNGGVTYVGWYPNAAASGTSILVANGGSGAVSATGGTAGTANVSNFPIYQFGIKLSINGTAGASSPVGTIVSALTPSLRVSGGAAGAGYLSTTTSFAGGNVNMIGNDTLLNIPGGAAGGAGNAGDGSNGTSDTIRFQFYGGAGGGSSVGGNGGKGGDGGLGCGGGGGGCGSIPGNGGRGGDGFVIIQCG